MSSLKSRVIVSVVVLQSLFFGSQATAEDKTPVTASSEIPEKRIYNLNEKIKPCDDFHEYVCSNVEASFKLREDRSSHTFSFSDSSERLLEKKKQFFLNIDSEKKLSKRSLQMKSYYKACMNEKESAQEEVVLVKDLKATIGNVKTIENFIALNKKNMENDEWTFLSYEITPNINKPLVYDITFDANFMFLPEHSYYENKELTDAYAQLMADFFATLYPEADKADLFKRAQAVVDFEKKYKEIAPRPAEMRKRWTEASYVKRADYLKLTGVIGLEDFFKRNVPAKTLIRDFVPESFVFAQKELKQKNLQVLKDMYIFRSARGFMDDAYPALFQKRLDFSHKYLGGAPVRADRQERCTSSVMGAFGKELDLELMNRIFKNFPKQKMVDVTVKIRQSIIDGIKKNTWLSLESKKGALEKIEKASLQIIQPNSDKEWDFKPVQSFSDTKPYANGKKLALASHKRTLERLRKGVNVHAWGMPPLTVNAYYDPTKNKFVMPIGILQYPFFVPEGDLIENLGAVGAVVGHELGHSIDDEGSKFNAQGELKQWMTDADLEKFKARGVKMTEQFDKIGHNGSLTLGENVADLVGLTFAYNAAFPDNKGTIVDKKKFFVANARLWCEVEREKAREMQLKTDPHSLGYARINEQMKHQPGFQQAYSCKKGDKLFLEPKDQITIW